MHIIYVICTTCIFRLFFCVVKLDFWTLYHGLASTDFHYKDILKRAADKFFDHKISQSSGHHTKKGAVQEIIESTFHRVC